jgi:hypothetical protein
MTDVTSLLERANPIRLDEIGETDDLAASALLASARRPGRTPAWRRPHVRWSARLVFATVIVLGVGVPLAFGVGFGGWLMQIVSGSAVPPSVRKQFLAMEQRAVPPREGPPGQRALIVETSSEHLVARIHTQEGRVASLYVARVRGGGWCTLATGTPFGGGGCGRAGLNTIKLPIGFGGFGSYGARNGNRIATALTSFGHATSPKAASIRVTYRDGTSASIPLSEGWYLYDVPLAHVYRGHEPIRFDVLDASGGIVGTARDPFVLEAPYVAPSTPVPATVRELARSPLDWRSADVVLSGGRDAKGERCIRTLNTGDHVQTLHWYCGPEVGNRFHAYRGQTGPGLLVSFSTGQRVWPGKPGYVYVHGWAAPPVVSLELRYQDSIVQPLPLHDRLFLFVVPRDHYLYGHRPSYVIGRDASGAIVYRQFLYPRAHCSYPGPGNQCPPGQITVNG